MAKPLVILISGKQGSGKSTLASNLGYELDPDGNDTTLLLKFADPLYSMHNMIKIVCQQYQIPFTKNKDGRLLQLLGTEWARQTISEQVWAECLERRVLEAVQVGYKFILVDDLRFRTEFNQLNTNNLFEVFKIRLNADPAVREARTDSWRIDDSHASEMDLDTYEGKFDLVLDSSALDEEELLDNVLDVLEDGGDISYAFI